MSRHPSARHAPKAGRVHRRLQATRAMERGHRPHARVTPAARRANARSRGQILVIFAGAIVALLTLCSLVVDVAWYWSVNLRIQRAADAAALAGVVFLPGNPAQADLAAKAEAAKNGYTDGQSGVHIVTAPDSANDRRLKVSIQAPVGTFFARAVGIDSFPARRDAKADYVKPVPMGSPDNYFGIGYWVKPETTTATSTGDTDWRKATSTIGTGWAAENAPRIDVALLEDDAAHAVTTADGGQVTLSGFGFTGTGGVVPKPASNQSLTLDSLQVRLTDPHLSFGCPNSRIGVDLNWTALPTTWSTRLQTPDLTTDPESGPVTLGGDNAAWGSGSWRSATTPSDLRVRLTSTKGCAVPFAQLRLDKLEVRARWSLVSTITTLVQDAEVPPPPGQAPIARPQKFWGAMQSQGAPSVQGDAFLTRYETRAQGGGGTLQTANPLNDPDARYDPDRYYDYAIEIPGGSGTVWIFDPGFCDASGEGGTGERWNVSGTGDTNPTGNPTRRPISSFFDLWDTRSTLLDTDDDLLVASTGSAFRRQAYEDHTVLHELDRQNDGNATDDFDYSQTDCSTQPGHFGWYTFAQGLPAGTYRLHTTSTDAAAPLDQDDSTGLNAFAFYAASTFGSPRIYGLGTMEAYVRLPGGTRSSFYLAQIDAVHAGKTMILDLWDPGDTNDLNATIRILQPTGSGFTPARFDWHSTVGTSNPSAAACNGRSGSDVDTIVTNTGGNSLFNGCWLTIELQSPNDYSAPVDPESGERGWWKIEYEMGGSATQFSTDLTTWTVSMRGNPVHLVLP